jgi:hypothetical protein
MYDVAGATGTPRTQSLAGAERPPTREENPMNGMRSPDIGMWPARGVLG